MEPLKILQIVPRIAAESSGPSVSVPSLSRSLAELGHDVNLFTLEPEPRNLLFKNTRFFSTIRLPFCHRLGVSPSMKRSLRDTLPEMDIVHTNSLWMMPNIYPGTLCNRAKCKLVISPRGTVSDWALSRARFRKGVVWRLGQRQALEAADCIHVTSQQELKDVRRLGLKQPVAVIPNGVSCPPDYMPRDRTRQSRTCLFLARIHPTKGIHRLLEAWKRVANEYPDWDLKIAGPVNSKFAHQIKQDAERDPALRIKFLGEVRGESKQLLYSSSDLYVLPTHSENFGISVAEALANGVPSIVFTGAPWSGLNEQRAGWWIEPSVDNLVAALRDGMGQDDDQREAMGRRGHVWVKDEFDWAGVGDRVQKLYKWLLGLGRGPKLPFVHCFNSHSSSQ